MRQSNQCEAIARYHQLGTYAKLASRHERCRAQAEPKTSLCWVHSKVVESGRMVMMFATLEQARR